MPAFRLRLKAPSAVTAGQARASFFWRSDNHSSFTGELAPSLALFGPVPDLNIDLVRIAVGVFAADRSTPRKGRGSDWNQRQIELTVPVSDPDVWGQVDSELKSVIDFLTGDDWTLGFVKEARRPRRVSRPELTPKRVVLLSGGADSAIGALKSRAELASDEAHVLLSHYSFGPLAPIQRATATTVETLLPGPSQQHIQIHFARNRHRADGTEFPTEPSSRSRSLLFVSLGLAAAAVHEVPLWIPENGFASLNPPLGPERRGSLSTRTTHPAFLGGLVSVLDGIGAHHALENPFAHTTKGEMFTEAASLVGRKAASRLLSSTSSCAHTGQRAFGVAPTTACGVCFGCVVRRASFHASGLRDRTSYIDPTGNTRLGRWLDSNSVERAVQSFARRGVRSRDLVAMSLPRDYSVEDALDLCRRGSEELAELYR